MLANKWQVYLNSKELSQAFSKHNSYLTAWMPTFCPLAGIESGMHKLVR